MFFCVEQLDLLAVVEKLSGLLKKEGVVSGIAMFAEDVTSTTEKVVAFREFHDKMSKYFCCKEISKLEARSDFNDDEKLHNSMYSRFTYVRRLDPEVTYNYLLPFVIPLQKEGHELELELRSRVDASLFESLRKMIRFGQPFNNSYTYYDLHVYDQHLREYDSGDVDLKSLLFRRRERVWGFSYNVCFRFYAIKIYHLGNNRFCMLLSDGEVNDIAYKHAKANHLLKLDNEDYEEANLNAEDFYEAIEPSHRPIELYADEKTEL
ncbi:hypothetical protein IW152_005476, partial [Coemansia sp. BCRC 34962]